MKNIFYKLPLDNIPFNDIPTLTEFSKKYVLCSRTSLQSFMHQDLWLVSVYDIFDQEQSPSMPLLFGRVVSSEPTLRGKSKTQKVKVEDVNIKAIDLPHLKYCNSEKSNWFFVKDGNYFIFSAVESTFEKVRHLEELSIYGDNIVRLRIVIELLKRNIHDQRISHEQIDFNSIAFAVLRAEPTTMKVSDDEIINGVNNWLPTMLETPLLDTIPAQIRERAIF